MKFGNYKSILNNNSYSYYYLSKYFPCGLKNSNMIPNYHKNTSQLASQLQITLNWLKIEISQLHESIIATTQYLTPQINYDTSISVSHFKNHQNQTITTINTKEEITSQNHADSQSSNLIITYIKIILKEQIISYMIS